MSKIRFPGRAATCAALACLLVALPVLGPVPQASAEESIQLNLGEQEVAMEDFLLAVRKATGRNLLWNPADKNIRGRKILGGVTLSAPKDEFLDAVRSLLTFYELVMVPVGPAGHEVLLIADARQSSVLFRLKPVPVTLDEGNLDEYAHKDGLFVTTTIEVQHMTDLRAARNALTRIVTGQNIGNVTEVPDAKAFVVTDFAPNVVAIYRLLKRMDRPSAASSTTGAQTRAFELEHAESREVVELLLSQFGQSSPGVTGPTRQPQAVAGPSAPRIAADVRTNRVIVTGSADELEAVRGVITLLDVPVAQPEVEIQVIPLKHIRADQAAGAIVTLVRGTPALWRGDKNLVPSVVSHSETNALLVSGTRDTVARIRTVIQSMDVERK